MKLIVGLGNPGEKYEKTRHRIFKKIENNIEDFRNGKISQYSLNQSIESYLGFLKNANSYRLTQKIKGELQFRKRGRNDTIL